jgi:hypothetical protein
MAATAEQLARLRRMAAEPVGTSEYTEDDLAAYIERYPVLDARGEAPITWDTATTPPAAQANGAWIPTYDLHAAAADVWEEKAGVLAGRSDFSADGATYHLSQGYEQMMARVRYHRARRTPATSRLVQWPDGARGDMVWIGNLPEVE